MIKVKDIDPLVAYYTVMESENEVIGKKTVFDGVVNYEKPTWRHGIKRRYKTLSDQQYKGTPPWMGWEVKEIKTTRNGLTLLVEPPAQERIAEL